MTDDDVWGLYWAKLKFPGDDRAVGQWLKTPGPLPPGELRTFYDRATPGWRAVIDLHGYPQSWLDAKNPVHRFG